MIERVHRRRGQGCRGALSSVRLLTQNAARRLGLERPALCMKTSPSPRDLARKALLPPIVPMSATELGLTLRRRVGMLRRARHYRIPQRQVKHGLPGGKRTQVIQQCSGENFLPTFIQVPAVIGQGRVE